MKVAENQIFTTNYKGFQIEIFLSDVRYAFVLRKDEFEDIEKGYRTPKEALIQAKGLIDAAEKFNETI
ncbi:hypothetical protein ACE1AT_25250 [Pelatocladus sp. BLCC-F211]|uniref:hypothetical protein n=1 Tax=Pelatocladus sp. BLCC-F211 TaxID=3342752 RepID=UPI0035B84B7C